MLPGAEDRLVVGRTQLYDTVLTRLDVDIEGHEHGSEAMDEGRRERSARGGMPMCFGMGPRLFERIGNALAVMEFL
jgi:hypothetical protein